MSEQDKGKKGGGRIIELIGVSNRGLVLHLSTPNPVHLPSVADFVLDDVNDYIAERLAAFERLVDEKREREDEAAMSSPAGDEARREAAEFLARMVNSGAKPN